MELRRELVSHVMSGDDQTPGDRETKSHGAPPKQSTIRDRAMDEFSRALEFIGSIRNQSDFHFRTPSGMEVRANVEYEFGEFQRDLAFCKEGSEGVEKEMAGSLAMDFRVFDDEVEKAASFIQRSNADFWITDRDGTIHRYSPLYMQSHQAAYNGIFLSRYSQALRASAVLTSGPLQNPGVLDLSCFYPGSFYLAASRGRELVSLDGTRTAPELSKEARVALQTLQDQMDRVLSTDPYASFRWIGSGFQVKYGQLTVAIRDQFQSVPEDLSNTMKNEFINLVLMVDPQQRFFHIEDTGFDLEISVLDPRRNEDPGSRIKDFDKGDGLTFLLDQIHSKTGQTATNLLISGDTPSDLPMIEAGLKNNRDVFFVYIHNQDLTDREQSHLDIATSSMVVRSPDILVAALNRVAKKVRGS